MAFDYSTVDLEAILKRSYDAMDELQRPGVAKARKSGRIIFDMVMGTGKTFAALTSGFCFKPQRWVIICSKNAVNAFVQEIHKWYPEFAGSIKLVRGTAAERHAAYKTSSLFFITTGASFLRDLDFLVTEKIAFDVITIDEADKVGLRNHKSKTYAAIEDITKDKHYQAHIKRVQKLGAKIEHLRSKVSLVNICTGTLTSKGVPQLFGYLHLMDPKLFSSYWKFIHTFMHVVDGPFGKEFTIPRNTEALAQCTYPYIHRVTEKDAAEHLPPLRRIRLPFEMPKKVADLYNMMAEELYFHFESHQGMELQAVSSTLAQSIKLRQLLCCPAIIDPALGHGSCIEAIAEKILENSEDANFTHNVVFTPFLASIQPFKAYLSEALKLDPNLIYTMQGGMEAEEVQDIEIKFRKNPKSLIVCSTMFAASFNLESGLNCYHAHFSWNQDDNRQAEGRIRRKTSNKERTVMSYYAYVPNTVSEAVLEVMNQNTTMNNITYQDFQRIRDSLKRRL